MLTESQIQEIRSRMQEEHRRDIEALERLMRFLPVSAQPNGKQAFPPAADNGMAPEDSVLGGIERILRDHANRTWTSQQIRAELERRGFGLKAKNPMATISVALKKLEDRDKATVVMRGSGREPNRYQWKKVSSSEAEALE
jgi:hypothetical protein